MDSLAASPATSDVTQLSMCLLVVWPPGTALHSCHLDRKKALKIMQYCKHKFLGGKSAVDPTLVCTKKHLVRTSSIDAPINTSVMNGTVFGGHSRCMTAIVSVQKLALEEAYAFGKQKKQKKQKKEKKEKNEKNKENEENSAIQTVPTAVAVPVASRTWLVDKR